MPPLLHGPDQVESSPNKEALYRFVAGRELAGMAGAVQLDPADLPGCAGQLRDHVIQHSERHRLMLWGQRNCRLGKASPEDLVQESLRRKIELLRKSQAAGHLDPAWD